MNDQENKLGEAMSRRAAAKHALKVLLATVASLLGFAVSAKKAHAGYGACSVSGCNCQAYMGSDNTCANCGHNYSLHW
jgi:hypothetical protein